jgi:A/G-specific adenine glycosylase
LLRTWYARHGRHDLSWRTTRDRWAVLVSEVMLHQTQVVRVAEAWPAFMAQFPAPDAMARAGPGAVIAAWDRLGYPRRARRLWEAAVIVADRGWPDDLTELPGVGRYTAAAVAAQADGVDVVALDVNVRRVVERVVGRRLGDRDADDAARAIGKPLTGRDRLLALMDVGALLCRPRAPRCDECPLRAGCVARGPLDGERCSVQGRFEGSFRQRRGRVLAALRAGPTDASAMDADALSSLVADGLAAVDGATASLPGSSSSARGPTR